MTAHLTVRVQPGARHAAVVGRLADGSVKVRVREPAERGRANRAVEELLAARLGLAPGQLVVVRGGASRVKVVEVQGLGRGELEARLTAALEGRAGD